MNTRIMTTRLRQWDSVNIPCEEPIGDCISIMEDDDHVTILVVSGTTGLFTKDKSTGQWSRWEKV